MLQVVNLEVTACCIKYKKMAIFGIRGEYYGNAQCFPATKYKPTQKPCGFPKSDINLIQELVT